MPSEVGEDDKWCLSRLCWDPYCFFIFVNDLLDETESYLNMSVDDVKLMRDVWSSREGKVL